VGFINERGPAGSGDGLAESGEAVRQCQVSKTRCQMYGVSREMNRYFSPTPRLLGPESPLKNWMAGVYTVNSSP
jgi:hypothetical protein